jgi:hypothetical protein
MMVRYRLFPGILVGLSALVAAQARADLDSYLKQPDSAFAWKEEARI